MGRVLGTNICWLLLLIKATCSWYGIYGKLSNQVKGKNLVGRIFFLCYRCLIQNLLEILFYHYIINIINLKTIYKIWDHPFLLTEILFYHYIINIINLKTIYKIWDHPFLLTDHTNLEERTYLERGA